MDEVAGTQIQRRPSLLQMAKAGPQSIPGVGLKSAYRFTSGEHIGFVYKHRQSPAEWEAIILGTPIAARSVLRREAVELALRQVNAQPA